MTLTPEVLKAALEQVFGATWDDIHATFTESARVANEFNELAPIVRDVWREKEQSQLKQAWGDEFDGVYSYLAEKVFPTLPSHEQALYNNAAGLQVLAQRYRSDIEAHLTSQQPATPEPAPVAPNKGVGQVLPNRPASGQPAAPAYRQSQILALSPEEYEAQRPAIEQAFASGAVDMDI